MLKFEYLTFVCEQGELQKLLSQHGAEGWRLHTCDAVVTWGSIGSNEPQILVVMDQTFQEEEPEEEIVPETAHEGLAMKG